MNKHVIMQKLLSNEEVSDSLFRKIYQFLDVVDSNDVEKMIEIFKEFYPEDNEIEHEPTENGSDNSETTNENSENSDESWTENNQNQNKNSEKPGENSNENSGSGIENSKNQIESQVLHR